MNIYSFNNQELEALGYKGVIPVEDEEIISLINVLKTEKIDRDLASVIEDEFLQKYLSIEGYPSFVSKLVNEEQFVDFNSRLSLMSLGLSGEIGEMAQLLCDIRLDSASNGVGEDLNAQVISTISNDYVIKIIYELGDICWYCAFACKYVLNVKFKEVEVKDLVRSPDQVQKLSHHVTSLNARSGVISDLSKKIMFHGVKYKDVSEEIRCNISFVMGVVALIANDICGVSIEHLIKFNVRKLNLRFSKLEFNNEEAALRRDVTLI